MKITIISYRDDGEIRQAVTQEECRELTLTEHPQTPAQEGRVDACFAYYGTKSPMLYAVYDNPSIAITREEYNRKK